MPRDASKHALMEVSAALKAEFAFKQRIERLRWERDVLEPKIAEAKAALTRGERLELELPE